MRSSLFSLLLDSFLFLAIIVMFSCLPAFFLSDDISFLKQVQFVFRDILHPASLTFPASAWTREPFLLPPLQWSQPSEHETLFPLFPYILGPYSITLVNFLFSLCLGFLSILWLGKQIHRAPSWTKRIFYAIKWLPSSILTVLLQFGTIFLFCKVQAVLSLPYISTIVIIVCASFVFAVEAAKGWLPSYIAVSKAVPAGKSLLLFFLSARKSILFSTLITISFFEFLLHADGLVNFLLRYYLTSPAVTVIGITMLYIPYFFFTAAQAVLWNRRTPFLYHVRQPLQPGAEQ
ncbi:hypothetical protein [Ectobacillus panaciterrae]|uniref:hypothetical protein n=1 Tax=Ectobacillus panaciterrae TaxID=363872 RepID=UPI000401BBFB